MKPLSRIFLKIFIKIYSTVFRKFTSCEIGESLNSQVGWRERYSEKTTIYQVMGKKRLRYLRMHNLD